MIKSMTGFGRSEYNDGKRNIITEIKSVNHRYCDVTVKMPRRYAFAEERLKSLVKKVARRGKVDLSVIVENITEDDTTIKLNKAVAAQYIDNLREMKESFGIGGDITVSLLAGLPDLLKAVPDVADEEAIFKCLSIPVVEAAERLDTMRRLEGEKLAADIVMRAGIIRELVEKIETRSPLVTKSYMEKMKERIKELIDGDVKLPEDRILTEAAIFADKCSVTEELVRLRSHIKQLEGIITNSSQPDGKKLDFLMQEMNREANTIGSKANDLDITNMILDIKSEIEKIREQVQNIE